MSGKRGQFGRMRKLTLKERKKKQARNERRDRQAKTTKHLGIMPGERSKHG